MAPERKPAGVRGYDAERTISPEVADAGVSVVARVVVAIRIRNLGRYFGHHVEIDGAERPREAWRSLLQVAGFDVKPAPDDDIQRTITVPGHVLRDISLDIDEASVVCLLGPSGSGKSVFLKILAGVIPPTSGSVEMRGRVSSLLAVGDNLDVRLTAYQNIEKVAQALTTSPEEISKYAEEVIAFAGLEGFEHVAIRTFSTGMTLRLSIGLALAGRPSIVLIDDVLGVGDIAFQQRCVDRLHALKEDGCTLVLAFSDDTLVQQLATRFITLGGGHIVGDMQATHQPVARFASSAADVEWRITHDLVEDNVVALRSVTVQPLRIGDESAIDVRFVVETKEDDLRCWPTISLMRGRVAVFRSIYPEFLAVEKAGRVAFTVRVSTHILSDGDYTVTIAIVTRQGHTIYSLKAYDAVTLTIQRQRESTDDTLPAPVLTMTMPWEIEAVGRA